MRVTLMHNPAAGDGQPGPDEITGALRRAGYRATYRSTKDPGWKTALEHPGELVVVAGGDGTVRKIARRLIGRGVPLGILPLGTANNMAATLGIEGDLEAVIDGWSLGRRKRLDVGFLRSPWGEDHFLESAGLGLFPHAMTLADAREAELAAGGPEQELSAAYRLIGALVPRYAGTSYRVRVDGADLSGDYLLVEVMNTGWIGPNLNLGWGADPGDGLLQVVLAETGRRDELARYFEEHEPGDEHPPPVTVRQGRRVEIRWAGAKLHVDDEIWPEADADPEAEPSAASPRELDVRVEPGALEVLLPPP